MSFGQMVLDQKEYNPFVFLGSVPEFSNSTDYCSGDVTADEAYYSAIVLGFFRLVGKLSQAQHY